MAQPGSYLEIARAWRPGDTVEMHLPMQARWEAFGDAPDVAALVYGPVVLAQQLPLGEVPADLMHEQGPKLEKAPASGIPESLPRDLPSKFVPAAKPLHFTAEAGARTIAFAPINDSWERYSVYSKIA
jgi:hypothetical protein